MTNIGSVVPWRGKARGLTEGSLQRVADGLGLDVRWLRAVMAVEAAGEWFRPDGSLRRRFEPHLMPGADFSWRRYRRTPQGERDAMFRRAFSDDREASLMATSWGGFQILGRWHDMLGYPSAEAMVSAFADSAEAQLRGFALYITSTGGAAALRSGDLEAFVKSYNGSGNVAAYSRKLRAALKAQGVDDGPPVLALGDRGPAVRDLQRRLGVTIDGDFGPETRSAVVEFQDHAELPVDGIAGSRTWGALRSDDPGPAVPPGVEREGEGGEVERGLSWLASGQVAVGGILSPLQGAARDVASWVLVVGVGLLVALVAARVMRRVLDR